MEMYPLAPRLIRNVEVSPAASANQVIGQILHTQHY
jgi:hypothetical protein